MIFHPRDYFRQFMTEETSWNIAYAGYFLVSFSKIVGRLADADVPPTPPVIVLRAALGSILGAFGGMLFFGLFWFYLGTKIAGGSAPASLTVRAVGHAFFWPSLVGLLAVPIEIYLSTLDPLSEQYNLWLIVLMAISLPCFVWMFVLLGIGVAQLNGFNLWQSLLAILWLPFALFGLVATLFLIFPPRA